MAREQQPEDENPAPGPDPARTPGLDDGGSVPPGETPPEAASASRAVSYNEGASTTRPAKWLWIAFIVLIAALVALFFVAMGLGILNV
ncbi:DUF6480 family protein [Bounagaea algeriensis]